jgi:lipoprotein-anchoring transpeptidase ErfK/SrfK
VILPWLPGGVPVAQAQDGNGIVTPTAGAEVSGVIDVEGVATHPTFRKWQLDLLAGGDEQQAHFLALGEQPVPEPAVLTQLDTRLFAAGEHMLRLRVVYEGLNYDEYLVPLVINNSGAALPASLTGDESVVAEGKPAAPPEPVRFRADAPADGKRWIEIDISDQALTAWQGDVPVFQTTVSTGKPGWRTLPGTFAVYRKYEKTRMRGADYDTPDVPWTMYYKGGFAIHGAYWHDNFGTPVSHGCVNLRVPEAKALFEWADVGTEVVVHN